MAAKLYTFSFLIECTIGVLYTSGIINFLSKGLSLADASLSWGIYMAAIAVFEIPTGHVADKYGRKLSTLIGVCIITSATFCLAFTTTSLWTFLALLISGVGFTLVSGAKTVWLLDLYLKNHPQKTAHDFLLRLDIVRRVGLIVAALFGTVLSESHAEFLWMVCGVIGVVAFLWGSSFPNICKLRRSTTTAQTVYFLNLKHSFNSEPSVKKFFVYFYAANIFFAVNFGVVDIILQPYSLDAVFEADYKLLALLFAGLHFSGVLGNLLYHRYGKHHILLFQIFVPIMLLAVQLLQLLSVGLYGFFILWWVMYTSMGWFYPTRDILITQKSPSGYEATMLSIDSFLDAGARAVTAIGLGWYFLDHLNGAVYQRLWVFGSVFLLLMIVTLYKLLFEEGVSCQAIKR